MANPTHIFGAIKLRVRGVALLMVVVSLALISAVVTELIVEQSAQYQIALRQRDALKAEALAESGVNLAGMFLSMQQKIQKLFTQFSSMGVPLPKHTIWEMLSIDSALLGGLVSGTLATTLGIDVSESIKKRQEEEKAKIEKKLKEREQDTKGSFGEFVAPEGGFGAFEGSFTVSVTDEESKITFRRWAELSPKQRQLPKRLLKALIVPVKYDYLFKKVDREDLLANIFDYLDADEIRINPKATGDDWGQAFGGSEEELYLLDKRDKNIKPKNAYFDSLGELNLVHGFTDRHMEAFGSALTVYGKDEKINILSAKDPVIEVLIRVCAKNEFDPQLLSQKWVDGAVKKWSEYKSSGAPVSAKGFTQFLSALPLAISQKECESVLGVESENFTLKSQATVNDVTRTMTLVVRINKSEQERYYFRSQ